MTWEPAGPVLRYRDSCNVYAVPGVDGTIVVDAGSGRWLEHVDELPAPPVALLLTHFFRDHAAGAVDAGAAGIPVLVPEGEAPLLADPGSHFAQRDPYVNYDNYWDHFVPIVPLPIAGVLRDYEVLELAGLRVEVLPLPGATVTQVGFAITGVQGERLVFCGETIHSPGRIARIAPLQYGYNDLPGAWNVILSGKEVVRAAPSWVYPSLGEPVGSDVPEAFSALASNLRRHHFDRTFDLDPAVLDGPSLVQLSDHVWRTGEELMQAYGTFVVSDSGKILALDSGWETFYGFLRPIPWRRRPTVRMARELVERLGASGIDVVVPSHYHDDHVAAIPVLQRVLGAQCWCPSWFADILERPEEFAFPCLWPVPARIDRRLEAGEPFTWEGVEFSITPISGHTRFAAAIGWEIDGIRFAHTGDQYHLAGYWQGDAPPTGRTGWAGDWLDPNHVYKNGATLRSYRESAAWLGRYRPDVVLTGHQRPIWTDQAFFDEIDRFARDFEAAHEAALPLGAQDTHFDIDSWSGWLRPYRTVTGVGEPVRLTATVRNPFAREATLSGRLVSADGWASTSGEVRVAPRAEATIELTVVPTCEGRRRPVALELVADGVPFGQVAEALVTVGHGAF